MSVSYELTVLMPCLNEAETIAVCIQKAQSFFASSGIKGEVLVADNGSTDGSQAIAESLGARVVAVPERGYGAALKGGIKAARGRFVIMGDADDSYDFSALSEMLGELRAGAQLVMGNRFKGGIKPGAMPFLHRYLGNPVLSFLGRLFYRVPIGDFHCGLRGFSREAILHLQLETSGMEFASEMVVKSALNKLKISEVPVVLSPDGRSRSPHLRTWRDGWRHLRFLLLFSPRWLFLLPGLLLLMVGALSMGIICFKPIVVRNVGLDIHTLAYSGAALLLGFQMIIFAVLSNFVGVRAGWLPDNLRWMRAMAKLTLERILVASILLFGVGLLLSLHAVSMWAAGDFGALDPRAAMRWVVPAVTSLALGGELFLAAFFLETLRLPVRMGRLDCEGGG